MAKFIFNKGKSMIEHPKKLKEESVLVMLGNVPNIDEFDEGRIIMVASQSLLLFEKWKCVREYKETNDLNFFTMSLQGETIPMGYIHLLPGFEHIPIVIVAGSTNFSIVNFSNGYMEPFIYCDYTSSFGQPAFFFKKEDFGMSITFPSKRHIDDTHVRYNWIRMPLKSDFMDILKRYERLPFTRTEEALAMKSDRL